MRLVLLLLFPLTLLLGESCIADEAGGAIVVVDFRIGAVAPPLLLYLAGRGWHEVAAKRRVGFFLHTAPRQVLRLVTTEPCGIDAVAGAFHRHRGSLQHRSVLHVYARLPNSRLCQRIFPSQLRRSLTEEVEHALLKAHQIETFQHIGHGACVKLLGTGSEEQTYHASETEHTLHVVDGKVDGFPKTTSTAHLRVLRSEVIHVQLPTVHVYLVLPVTHEVNSAAAFRAGILDVWQHTALELVAALVGVCAYSTHSCYLLFHGNHGNKSVSLVVEKSVPSV